MSWVAVEKALTLPVYNSGAIPKSRIVDETFDLDESEIQTPFIQAFNLTDATDTLDKFRSERYNGIYQLSVFYALGVGKSDMITTVDSIISSYDVNELPELDSCKVAISSISRGEARRDGKFMVVDVSIDYFALMSK